MCIGSHALRAQIPMAHRDEFFGSWGRYNCSWILWGKWLGSASLSLFGNKSRWCYGPAWPISFRAPLPWLIPSQPHYMPRLLEPSMAVDDGGPGQRYLPVQRPGGFRDLRSVSECWGYCLKVHISVICFTVALQFLFIHLPSIHWILVMCWTQSLLSGKCGMKQSLCKVGTSS